MTLYHGGIEKGGRRGVFFGYNHQKTRVSLDLVFFWKNYGFPSYILYITIIHRSGDVPSKNGKKRSTIDHPKVESKNGQKPGLVNIQKTMENHHFPKVNQLFLWPFPIAICMFTRG